MSTAPMPAIAITGMACRFPGAPSLHEFWMLLCEGRAATGAVPPRRWNSQQIFDADPKVPGKSNSRSGGFLEDIERFDAAFFGISPREAVQMDPQQRLLLELAYEALEDAGVVPGSLAGSETAVFVGAMTNDYFRQQLRDDYRHIDVHTGSGAGLCMLANRLSYQFDLRGPSLTIDTACSSSLVAVFQACQSLWHGQSRLAIAAGANVMLDAAFNVFYAKAGLSAPDGRCKTFSAAADGIGRAEGAAVVVLKRLADALADGDPIYAVLRGGAVNHDGRSNGMTQPNRWAQEQLLRNALQHSAVAADDLEYLELHGTGTLIGDPIEANAIGSVLTERGARDRRCLVGSVKTNFGHLEAAAGIAGLIKLALSLWHAKIPPSLWFDAPNPHIDFAALPIEVNTQLRAWPLRNGSRLGGVSSFGLGGTNAHIILEAHLDTQCNGESDADIAPQGEQQRAATDLAGHCLLLSARSPAALRELADKYIDFLACRGDRLTQICASALYHKAIHDHRLCLLGADAATLIAGLEAFLAGGSSNNVLHGRHRQAQRHAVLVVPAAPSFDSCSMAHWLSGAPVARRAWEQCREACRAHADFELPAPLALREHATGTLSDQQLRLCQFAGQYALLQQLRSGLLSVERIVADGIGQLAALCAADALPVEIAVRWLAGELPERGCDEQRAELRYAVACDCASGRNPAIRTLQLDATGGWRARLAPASDAVEVILLDVATDAAALTERCDGVLRLGKEADSMARLFAQLALRQQLQWHAWADRHDFVRLPSYPWQREVYWLPERAASSSVASASADHSALPAVAPCGPVNYELLGWRSDVPGVCWQNVWTAPALPYLADHCVQGVTLLPGAGFVELGLALHAELCGQRHGVLEQLEFVKALLIEPQQPTQVRVHYDESTQQFLVYSRQSQQWQLHARGRLSLNAPAPAARVDLAALQQRCIELTEGSQHYEAMRARGFQYGPYFQAVRRLWLDPESGFVLARIEGHSQLEARHRLHPTLFDASLQSLLTSLAACGDHELYIPTGIEQLELHEAAAGNSFWCYGRLQPSDPGTISGEIVLFDSSGTVLAEARGIRAQALTRRHQDELHDVDQWLYRYVWERDHSAVAAEHVGQRWLLLVDASSQAEALWPELQAAGATQVVQVLRSNRCERLDASRLSVLPHGRDEMQWLLDEAGTGFAGIIYMWGLDKADHEHCQLPAPAQDTAPLLHLLQLLAQSPQVTDRLVVVTRNAQAVDCEPPVAVEQVVASQGPQIGLVRVAINEYPQLRLRLVDIDAEVATLATLAQEINTDSAEDEVALRGAQRFVHRMVRTAAGEFDPQGVRPVSGGLFHADATYLITGGCGGLGLKVAQWMAEQGAGHLVLAGRRGGDTPEAQRAIRALQRHASRVAAVAIDVSDAASVERLFTTLAAEWPPLKGIMHAAAVLDDAPLSQLTAAQIDNAMAAKASGAYHLHQRSLSLELDHFVMFSSVASMLGGPGQGSYAMACSYLDALARARRSLKLPAISINWGAIGQVGMATRFSAEVEKYLTGSGVGLFTPGQATQLLGRVLRANPVAVCVAKMDWQAWNATYASWSKSPKFAALRAVHSGSARTSSELLQTLLVAPAEARAPMILEQLIVLLAQTLQSAAESIDVSLPLTGLGLDSLMAMDLQVAIDKQLGVRIAMLELMKGNSLLQLAELLVQAISMPRAEESTPEPVSAEELSTRMLSQDFDPDAAERAIASLDQLADEEVERLLARLMQSQEIRQ